MRLVELSQAAVKSNYGADEPVNDAVKHSYPSTNDILSLEHSRDVDGPKCAADGFCRVVMLCQAAVNLRQIAF